jgi:hypothetical protein
MPDRNPSPPSEKPIAERRTPLDNDVDPDGMDSDSEGDEIAGPDGSVDRQSAGQGQTSGTHGAARPDTTRGSSR